MHNAARVARSLGVKSYDRDSEDMLPVHLMYIVVPRGRAARSYDRQLGNTLPPTQPQTRRKPQRPELRPARCTEFPARQEADQRALETPRVRPRLHAGLAVEVLGRAPETRRHQSKVRAEASQPRDQLLLVAFGALRLRERGLAHASDRLKPFFA